MRCEPWMNETPVPRKTPLQLARDDLRHWGDRMRSLMADLAVCDQEFTAARERVDRLEAEPRKLKVEDET